MASALQYGIGFAWIGVLVGKAAGRPLHSALLALASSVNVTCLQYRQNVVLYRFGIVCIALIYRRRSLHVGFSRKRRSAAASHRAALGESQTRRPAQNRRKVETVTCSICAR